MNILQELKKQKTGFTSFEIAVPDADENFIKKNLVYKLNSPCMNFYFTSHKKDEIKNIYFKLKRNFELEKGDLTYYCDPDKIYLISTTLMKKEFKKSNIYKYIGFLEVFDHAIQVVWIHPFFRNYGIFTGFLNLYGEDNIILIQPPLTKSMQACLRKFEIYNKENVQLKQKQRIFAKNYFKMKSPESRVDQLNDQEMNIFSEIMQNFQAILGKEKINNENLKKHIFNISELLIEIRENPEIIEYFKNLMISEEDIAKMKSIRNDFISGYR